jgi:site-specific recombinase XerD
VILLGRYSDCYANNQFRALQQFFKWLSAEESMPNPMAGLKPPKIDQKVVPVFTDEELAALLATSKGRGFQERRDHAILTLFRETGVRLSELAGLRIQDINLKKREVTVTGKGSRQRTVRFGKDSALAVDRYQRERARHQMADRAALWLGIRNRGPMTASGIYQMIKRRGEQAGVEVNPHKFRHHFSHTWLDKGGAEGDLIELNGWSGPQMLAVYGRSARSARARRSYDNIMDAS